MADLLLDSSLIVESLRASQRPPFASDSVAAGEDWAAGALPELAVLFARDDERLGEVIRLQPEPMFVESFRPGGAIGAETILAPILLRDIPADATDLILMADDALLHRIPLAEIMAGASPLPGIDMENIPREDGDYAIEFPVFSERYVNRARFIKHVESLYKFIITIPPFDTLATKLRLKAYYWKAPDQVGGWFDTRDGTGICDPANTEVVHGNNLRASAWLKHLFYKDRFGLVLIDSTKRGGAGGLQEHFYPAWATITSCPGERWEAIALHEIGHALGLCDEYLWAARESEEPRNEPNVTRNASAAGADWLLPANREGNPTSADLEPGEDIGAVGTYRGCRYRKDLYRSSPHCLMRRTTTLYFCPVCQEHIRRKLTT